MSNGGYDNDVDASTKALEYDYYWRPGTPLRPAPSRLHFSPIWSHGRKLLCEPWLDFEEVPRPTPWTDLVVDHLWQGDELMDAVVARFQRIGMAAGRKLLEQALDHGIESLDNPPAELVALFDQLDNPPSWYDAETWERGRQPWIDASLAGKINMAVGDFFGTFVGDEVSAATGQTGRYANDFFRRNLESIAWFHNTTVPGAMERHAHPFKDTVRVRLMHSQVRAGLRRSWGPAQFARHGNPISNAMMMAAAVTFALPPLLFDHAHGRTVSVADLDATMMYWSYIARVFGVAEELIPKNAMDGIIAMNYITAYAGGPSEWTESMARSAIDSGPSRLLTHAALTPVLGVAAYFGGTGLARSLVRNTALADTSLQPWIVVTGLAARGNVAFRRLLDHTPGASARAVARSSDEALWGTALRIARFAAARRGIRGTPYDHHDDTAARGAGCPVPQSAA